MGGAILARSAGALALAGCGSSGPATGTGADHSTVVDVVAAENRYGSVALQAGGRYVELHSVESNPNTDPHSHEVSPSVAEEVSAAGW